MLRGTDQAALEALDTALWLQPEDGFLPHGLAGGPQDADQPILLGLGAIGNGAQALMLLDGALTTADEAAALQRVWVLFDGGDEAAVARARGLWTALTGAGLAAQYWSEETGRWEKKSEKAAAVKDLG
jgi:DNA polymerase-3 subunit chi